MSHEQMRHSGLGHISKFDEWIDGNPKTKEKSWNNVYSKIIELGIKFVLRFIWFEHCGHMERLRKLRIQDGIHDEEHDCWATDARHTKTFRWSFKTCQTKAAKTSRLFIRQNTVSVSRRQETFKSELLATRSRLGWMVSGTIGVPSDKPGSLNLHSCECQLTADLSGFIRKTVVLEGLRSNRNQGALLSTQDRRAVDKFRKLPFAE